MARVLALLGAVIDVQVDLAADFSTSANTLSGRLPFFRKPVSFSLSLFRFINALMSNLELVLHLMLSGMLALHPGVSDDVGHRQPLVGMILEHTGDKILEFFREEARFMALALQFPEEVSPVRCDQFVLQIVGKSLWEGWVFGVQNEKNDSECKQIRDVALVLFIIQDFRCHVGRSAHRWDAEPGLFATLKLDRETKIDYLGVVILIKQDIFRFQVTVADAFRVKVVKAHQKLFEVKSANWWAEGSGVCYIVKKLTTCNEFLGDVCDGSLMAVFVGIDGVFLYVEELNQGLVVKISCLFNLSLGKLEELWSVAGLILLEDLECDFVAVLVPCFLDFGAEALPKGFAKYVVVDCCFFHLLMN